MDLMNCVAHRWKKNPEELEAITIKLKNAQMDEVEA